MFHRLRDFIRLHSALMRDPRTPARAKYLPWIALLYLLFPLDIVPDLFPLVGQIDDITVIALLLWLAISSISDGLYDEHRRAKRAGAIDVTPRAR